MTVDVPLMPGGRRLLGHAPEFGRDPLAPPQRAREHGDVVRVRFGPFQLYLLNSPGSIRQALTGQARKLEKGLSFGRVKRLIGDGLVMAEGESHRRQRRLMQPAFHPGADRPLTGHNARGRGAPDQRVAGRGSLALDRELRSIALTGLTRTLLSSDIGPEAVDEIERLLRVLLSELVTQGGRGPGSLTSSTATGGGSGPRRPGLDPAAGQRRGNRLADGADVHPVTSSTLVPSELPVIVTRRR